MAAALFLLPGAVSAASASAASWGAAQLPGAAGKVFLSGVSCPTTSLCVAVGTNNLIASSTDPTGGAAAWNVGYAGEGPWENTDTWPTAEISGHQITGVSCPSAELCVAVAIHGNIYATTHPIGPASAWGVASIDGEGGRNTHLQGVSCPTVTLCVAVTGGRNDAGRVLTSTDPTGGAAAWQTTTIDESLDLRAVSCGSPSLCVAVGEEGRIATSTNPTGGAAAWSVLGASAGPGSLRSVWCEAAQLCLAGNAAGNLLTSTAPLAGLSGWTETDGGGSVQITGVSCASASECLAVDDNGDVLISTDPTGGRSAWAYAKLIPYALPQGSPQEGNALFAASCPSPSLCTLTGARGQIFTSTDPFVPPPAVKATGRKHRRKGPKRPRAKVAAVRLTMLRHGNRRQWRATIRFFARGGASGFLCGLDGRRLRPCRSPLRLRRVAVGHHVFRVRAIGSTRLRGPVAIERFRIYPPCPDKFPGPQRSTDGSADALARRSLWTATICTR